MDHLQVTLFTFHSVNMLLFVLIYSKDHYSSLEPLQNATEKSVWQYNSIRFYHKTTMHVLVRLDESVTRLIAALN